MTPQGLEIRHATIARTELGVLPGRAADLKDRPLFTCWVYVDYGGALQGFGGYDLTRATRGRAFLTELLDTLGVATWEHLPGTPVRVKADASRIHALGHFTEERWFAPKER